MTQEASPNKQGFFIKLDTSVYEKLRSLACQSSLTQTNIVTKAISRCLPELENCIKKGAPWPTWMN